jgi:hypothetical protein
MGEQVPISAASKSAESGLRPRLAPVAWACMAECPRRTSALLVWAGCQTATHTIRGVHSRRPGGNMTGVASFLGKLGPKQFGSLREVVPKAETVTVLADPAEMLFGARFDPRSPPLTLPNSLNHHRNFHHVWRPKFAAYLQQSARTCVFVHYEGGFWPVPRSAGQSTREGIFGRRGFG